MFCSFLHYRFRQRNETGFSLLEVVVVLVIAFDLWFVLVENRTNLSTPSQLLPECPDDLVPHPFVDRHAARVPRGLTDPDRSCSSQRYAGRPRCALGRIQVLLRRPDGGASTVMTMTHLASSISAFPRDRA
jgi:hypothetical protein